MVFERIGNFQQLLQGTGNRQNIRYFRLSESNRTCFVKDCNLCFTCLFKCFGILEKNTVFCALSASDHNCNRRCKTESTRTAYNQNADGSVQRKRKIALNQLPYNKCNNRNNNNNRNKHGTYLVGKLCNRCLRRACVCYHFNYFCKCGIITYICRTAFDEACFKNCCTSNLVALRFINRHTLACQHCFVDCSVSVDNNAVNCYAFP